LALTAEAYQVRLIKITDGTSKWAHAIEIGDTLELRLDFTKVWAERHEDEPHNNNWTYRGCQQSFPIIDVAEEGGGYNSSHVDVPTSTSRIRDYII